MNFKDVDNEIEIKSSYRNLGEDGLAKAFLTPVLKNAKLYQRSVGFFSSGVLNYVLDGIVSMHRNHGKIQLITSPMLSQEDIDAINLGYSKRETVINDATSRNFTDELYKLNDDRLDLLINLIASGTLDIKIAVTKNTNGMYHDKFGILVDNEDNKIVFYGSPNSSASGYGDNYEKIRVVKSWVLSNQDSVDDEQEEFNSIWNGTNEFLDCFDYQKSAKENILKVIEDKKSSKKTAPVTLRDYQNQAVEAWVKNGYKGFFTMATGTGKTWTAIFSAKKLLENHKATIVICAPYKHLVKQWCDDVRKMFVNARIVLVSSENPRWEQEILDGIISKRYNSEEQLIVISTIASFRMDRFAKTINKDTSDKLLICDEAHRFNERTDEIKDKYNYLLGLSATPYSGQSAQSGKELMEYFGGEVFSLPIEKALEMKCLVGYYYHPIYVYASSEEEGMFAYHTQRMMACFRNGVLIDYDTFIKQRRSRLRVISMAEEKTSKFGQILKEVKNKNNFIVYCGDGRLFDDDSGEEIRHIQSVKRMLKDNELKVSQFTAKESMTDRMELIDAFNKGEISALAAIRCLDEGINIPSIKSALILSSNDDYREFVQRRGRILRQYEGKEYADIYDVVVLPSTESTGWAKIEFRRFYEYAKLSKNWDSELENEFSQKLSDYSLTIEDINAFEYEDVEEQEDE